MKRQYIIKFQEIYIYGENLHDAENKADTLGKEKKLNVYSVEEDKMYRKHNNISKEK